MFAVVSAQEVVKNGRIKTSRLAPVWTGHAIHAVQVMMVLLHKLPLSKAPSQVVYASLLMEWTLAIESMVDFGHMNAQKK